MVVVAVKVVGVASTPAFFNRRSKHNFISLILYIMVSQFHHFSHFSHFHHFFFHSLFSSTVPLNMEHPFVAVLRLNKKILHG